MQELKDLLQAHSFFHNMPVEYVELISGCSKNTVYKTGEVIFREGEDASYFYLIRQGKISREIYAPPRGSLIIDTLSSGDILGVSWLIPPYHWATTAQAVEDTRVIVVDAACLRKKCDTDPRMGYELMKRFAVLIGKRMEAARMRLIDIYSHSN
jgi:CRP/FNR family transcriptional regulator, cyclic AMP receptor protein